MFCVLLVSSIILSINGQWPPPRRPPPHLPFPPTPLGQGQVAGQGQGQVPGQGQGTFATGPSTVVAPPTSCKPITYVSNQIFTYL